jgi:hypothetical protein
MSVSWSFHRGFDMLSLKGREGVKCEIPRELYMAIVKLQASEELDWLDACVKAAQLLNSNSEEFRRGVEREARRIYNRRFMAQLNKAKMKVWNEGFEAGRRNALNSIFSLNPEEASKQGLSYALCPYCDKPIYGVIVDANDNMGKWVLDKIREAGWHHTKCAQK